MCCGNLGKPINDLLKESEKELAKHLLAGGITVPFQGTTEQTFTLHDKERQRNSMSGDSVQSECVVVATPATCGLSKPGKFPKESLLRQ